MSLSVFLQNSHKNDMYLSDPLHAHSPGVACASMSTTMPDNDDDNDNA